MHLQITLERGILQLSKEKYLHMTCVYEAMFFYTPCIPLGAHNTLIVLNADTDRGVAKINSSVGVITNPVSSLKISRGTRTLSGAKL